MKINLVLLSLIAFTFFSCQSTPKNISYLQDLDQYSQQELGQNLDPEPVIQNNDQLVITVSAPVLNQEMVAQFNLPAVSFLGAGETSLGHTESLQTYVVDTEGNIHFPVLGKIQLSGLKRKDASDKIADLISHYVDNPIVNVQITSFTVTILGEVGHAGTVVVRNGRLTILEAIGAAGDFTVYGKKENVLVIREMNGKKQYAYLDFTKSDILSSPYYYLKQNDVIIVDPNNTKKRIGNFGSAESYRLSIYSSILGTISLLATVATTIIALSK